MLDNDNELVPLPIGALEKLSKMHYEIRYINLEVKKEKPKIRVYHDESGFSIDMSAAFALNLIDNKAFMTSDLAERYYLSDNQIAYIGSNYDAEYIKAENIKEDKKK
jgi:hypothetical protein